MKIVHIILLSFVFILLVHCKKEDEHYPDDLILMDNAKAVVYFHTVFREAENAWAIIHNQEYAATYSDPANTTTRYKKMTYNEEENTVTIEYNAWLSANSVLMGNIYVEFMKDVYCTLDGAAAEIRLNNFSINNQIVVGEAKIRFQKVEDSENDHYSYTLLAGAAIHDVETSKLLISGTIREARYIRVNGLTTDDDTWIYSGTMEGKLGKDQSLNYTHTILDTYTGNNGETADGTVHFSTKCDFAEKGVAHIRVTGRTDIIYQYHCSGVDYLTVTDVD